MRKNLIAGILSALVLVLTLTIIPLTLNADMEWKSHSVDISVLSEDYEYEWVNPGGENINFVTVTLFNAIRIGDFQVLNGFLPLDISNTFSQDGSWNFGPYDIVTVEGIGTPEVSTSFIRLLGASSKILSTFQEFYGATIKYTWGQSVRTSELVCQSVWVNEKGNFQFVFWYSYRDNNWVKIYDMSGKEVYSIDMPYDNPQFEVSLPDGMYTVKTFHVDPATPIQTFIIGKP
jgi:hypothetical protein